MSDLSFQPLNVTFQLIISENRWEKKRCDWCVALHVPECCSARTVHQEELWLQQKPATPWDPWPSKTVVSSRTSSSTRTFFWEPHMLIISLNTSHRLKRHTFVLLTDSIHGKKYSTLKPFLPPPSTSCPSPRFLHYCSGVISAGHFFHLFLSVDPPPPTHLLSKVVILRAWSLCASRHK